MIKPMLLTLHRDPPVGEEWGYEVKYDGFRCLVFLDKDNITLQSRNGKSLNNHFPEIIDFLEALVQQDKLLQFIPLVLDAELTILTSPWKGNFTAIQKRGRTKTKETVLDLAQSTPATLLAFDILKASGKTLVSLPFQTRKAKLKEIFTLLDLPLSPNTYSSVPLQYVPYQLNGDMLFKKIKENHGEGIIAKKTSSTYQAGKRTPDWIKIKNFRNISCFITAYQKDNGYFHVAVMNQDRILPIGLFSHGMSSEERRALIAVVKENSKNEDNLFVYVEPGICVELYYLELYQGQLRHPEFRRFRFDIQVKDCTWNSLRSSNLDLPKSVQITHPEKPLWEEPFFSKLDYLQYLTEASPFLLPFLKNRLLTVIRYPHGMSGEKFYQKNRPDYAPEYVETSVNDGIHYIVCNNLETLVWLGNQLAIELHIPFQKTGSLLPCEIVFDLDPPSEKFFANAVIGALMMKEIFDQLQLASFVKTSGRKGLQVYIPLPEETFTYEQTRKFTEFVANYLVSKEPELFTIERLKKNRGTRVYVDFIQHAEGKTIIAPYSLRENSLPTVATPLNWSEVNQGLRPKQFTVSNVLERLKEKGDPFHSYHLKQDRQPFDKVLSFLDQV
ncbi:DNA ligase D [Sutcliffiella deserti]|uniref:DNA ligase D n=1 Tax=Sutcliffiella deserti TaxID=2875501 RepID=UPI001CBF1603|nr:DNA ligase D [Sutcliffiella deserti]